MSFRGKRIAATAVFCLLALFTATSLQAAFVPGKAQYRTLHTDHFRIHYPEDLHLTAKKAGRLFEEMRLLLGKEFDVYPKGKVEVLLTDIHDQSNGLATVIPYNFIQLRLVLPDADSPLAYYDDWLRLLIAHEYTHILNLSDAGYPAKFLKFIFGKIIAPNALAPSWVLEGMATYFESAVTGRGRGLSSYAQMITRTDIVKDQFLPIDKAAGSMTHWPAWRAGYIYGVGFWNYLSKTYGHEKVAQFSNKYGGTLWFFSLNNKAKRVFGKSFYKLWKDWQAELKTQYADVIAAHQNGELNNGDALIPSDEGLALTPAWQANGDCLTYVKSSPHHKTETRLKCGDEETILFKGHSPQHLSWSPDGQSLAFTSKGTKKGHSFTDLYIYDVAKKKAKPVTTGKRVRDPSFSPDGTQIAVSMYDGSSDQLALYNKATKKLKKLGRKVEGTRLDHLDWHPSKNLIAASSWNNDGYRDIVVFNTQGKVVRRIHQKQTTHLYPQWSPDGRSLFYSSDQNGIYNIYHYQWGSRRNRQLSHVSSGAFAPTVHPDGKSLAYQYYSGKGFEIRTLPVTIGTAPKNFAQVKVPETKPSLVSAPGTLSEFAYEDRPYTPWSPALLPHYIQPAAAFVDNTLFLSTVIGSFDPLARHSWYGLGSFRTDNKFVGFGGGYQYGRYATKFFTGFNRFSVNYGNIFGAGTDFFEERNRAFAGIRFALKRKHRFSLQYFFEDRSVQSGLPAAPPFQPVLGNYAGIRFNYTTGKKQQFIAGIGPDSGYWFRAGVDFTNAALGSSQNMERTVLSADARQYIKMPWGRHHTLAFRQVGGVALGDRLTQGTFAVGGSLGDSPIASASTRSFNLRGIPLTTFLRDRALVLSAEYRMPLFQAQRGLGTMPIFLRQASLSFFADYGNAWNQGQTPGGLDDFFDNFLLGVGAELRAHFVLGYHLPIMGRLGYGIIVHNRNRVAVLTGPILGQSINNGILILEFGTSF